MDCEDPNLFRARKVCATIFPKDQLRYFRGELDSTDAVRIAHLAFSKGREYGLREQNESNENQQPET
jgi:hypothetical protein